MIFKVFYQKHIEEVPVREATKALYVEADSERDVRKALADRKYNIEFIQSLEGAHLEYEKSKEYFKLENVTI